MGHVKRKKIDCLITSARERAKITRPVRRETRERGLTCIISSFRGGAPIIMAIKCDKHREGERVKRDLQRRVCVCV